MLFRSDPTGGPGLLYDLFAEGRSLSGGASLELTRANAPAPGTAYPTSFKVIDIIYRIAPAAAVPGLSIGIARAADQLGWQVMIAMLAGLLATMLTAGAIGVRTWSRVRADTGRSTPRRAAIGAIVAITCYGAAFTAWLAIALFLAPGRH